MKKVNLYAVIMLSYDVSENHSKTNFLIFCQLPFDIKLCL